MVQNPKYRRTKECTRFQNKTQLTRKLCFIFVYISQRSLVTFFCSPIFWILYHVSSSCKGPFSIHVFHLLYLKVHCSIYVRTLGRAEYSERVIYLNDVYYYYCKYLLLAECEVRTASYGPSFFLPFMAQARSARAMKTRKEKTRIHNLPYGLSKRG